MTPPSNMRRLALLVLVAALTTPPLLGADTTVGAHVIVDRLFTISDSAVGPELFVRISVSPGLALEASVSYRRYVTNGFGGSYTYTVATDQLPIFLGFTYLFSQGKPVRPWLSAGLIVAPESSNTTYSPSGSSYSFSTVDVGLQVGAGVQAAVTDHWALDGGVRYTPPMTSSDSRSQGAYSFLRFQAGLAYRF